MKNKYHIFIIGFPLSGKSTIGKELAVRMNRKYLSTGDVVRKGGLTDNDFQDIAQSDLVSRCNDKVMAAVEKAMKEEAVIDGFPRSVKQLEWLREHTMDDAKGVAIAWVESNPYRIYERQKYRALQEQREEDTQEIVAGRLKAMQTFKERVVEDVMDYKWKFIPVSTDDIYIKYVISKIEEEIRCGV